MFYENSIENEFRELKKKVQGSFGCLMLHVAFRRAVFCQ
jgi:hypothetical protein